MPTFNTYDAKLKAWSGMSRVMDTMKMVSTSHLHRARQDLLTPAPFAKAIRKLMAQLRSAPQLQHHRAIQEPKARNPTILIFILSSDRGLCGSFNSAVVREARHWVEKQRQTRNAQIQAVYIGAKAYTALKAEIPPLSFSPPVSAEPHPTLRHSNLQAALAIRLFLGERVDEVWLLGNQFVSTTVFKTRIGRLLPFAATTSTGAPTDSEHIMEPDAATLLASAVRQSTNLALYVAALNRAASEHAARMVAMDNGTRNLRRMRKELLVLRNRARQAAITNELAEIVSGAEAQDNWS